MSLAFQPRYYQIDAVNSIFNYFEKGNTGNPVVAMPTGTGKSVVIALFIWKVLSQWSNQKIIMLTHVKELIQQNAEKLQMLWPTAPLGIYSAGLKQREMYMPIVFGGVQSVSPAIKKHNESVPGVASMLSHFGWRDLMLIDECHLLSEKEVSQYQFIIAELKKINPDLKVIGFTATPYRMKTGSITENGIFTDICFDITDTKSFNKLIAEGYLAKLIGKPTRAKIDTSNVGVIGGEFNAKQLENAVDIDETVFSIVQEMCETAFDRLCWLVFATGIKNTEHFAAVLQSFGVDALPVHSKLKSAVNDERLEEYKRGNIRCIVSGQKLTTGFDNPRIDFIADANPTLSTGKHVQKLGRGTRPFEGKENCLVLDFGGNIQRLGPINNPNIPNPKKGKGGGAAPTKICPECGCYNHASARFCEECDFEFTFETNLFATAGNVEPLESDAPIIEYFAVTKVIYNLHEKRNKEGVLMSPPMIKASYFCGLQMFNEFVMLEHSGIAGKKSRDWWRQRHAEEPPPTTYQALQRITELRVPSQIKVWVNKKYPEILEVEF